VYSEGRLVGAFGVAGDDLTRDAMLAEEARGASLSPQAESLPRAA